MAYLQARGNADGSSAPLYGISAVFQPFFEELKRVYYGNEGKLATFVENVQNEYLLLRGASGKSAAEMGISPNAFGFAMVAFENCKGKAAAINVAALLPGQKEKFTKPLFSDERFLLYDMDKPQSAERVFLINAKEHKIEMVSRAPHNASSDLNGDGFMDKVGQNNQASPYGVMALYGERSVGWGYLFGQEKGVNDLVGIIPKRLHAGANTKGCVVLPSSAFEIIYSATSGFKNGATMVYSHFTGKNAKNPKIEGHGAFNFNAYLSQSQPNGDASAFRQAEQSKMNLSFIDNLPPALSAGERIMASNEFVH